MTARSETGRLAARHWGWLCLGLSLSAHAALLAILPGLSSPPEAQPQPIIVSLVTNSAATALPPKPAQLAGESRQQQVEPRRDVARPKLAAPLLPQALAAQPAPAMAEPVKPAPAHLPEPAPASSASGTPAAAGGPNVNDASVGEGSAVAGGATLPAPAPVTPDKPQASAPAVDVQALLGEYAAGVKSAILREKTYPAQAERRGLEGSVKLSFMVSADGELQALAVKASSGYDELDEAALSAVRAAAPFAPLPLEARRHQLALSITLRFSLN